jgi:peptidoglycan-associated lipoprotein
MRFIMVLALGLLAAACSSSGDQSGGATAGGTPAVAGAAPGTQAHLEQVTGSDRAFFDFDKYNLRPDAAAQVQRWVGWMQANPNAKVLVEGHADERGTREYNLALGARRSHSVRMALEAGGVASSRIETTTYGKDRPAVEGSNEEAWAQNRRAVMVVRAGGSS